MLYACCVTSFGEILMGSKKMHGSKISDEVDLELESELEEAVRSFQTTEKLRDQEAPPTRPEPKPIGHLAGGPGGPTRIPGGESAALLRECFDALLGRKALDPGSRLVQVWRGVFLVSCLAGLFVDPLILYWPLIRTTSGGGGGGGGSTSCIDMDRNLRAAVTWLRSSVDLLYLLNVFIKFRTAYVAPSSRVFGKGELVTDCRTIERRYARGDFSVDLAAAFPVPQVVMWMALPEVWRSGSLTLTLVVLVQYLLRLYLVYSLSDEIIKTARNITKSAWGGAAYNLLLYMLASHIVGAIWYLLTVQRQATCWLLQCRMEGNNSSSSGVIPCDPRFLDCKFSRSADYEIWAERTSVFRSCNARNSSITFDYGIFQSSLSSGGPSAVFIEKYFYGLWWGLQQLTSAGQNLSNSTFIGETLFAIVIAMLSLILFAQLIGNMQTYLQSINAKVEEWRLKQRDAEEWMRRRQFPRRLQHRVRQFVQYQWMATRGVDEQSILRGLPFDLRRDIQRHLCLDLVRRVPFFSEMDDQLQDAICERLDSSLCTKGTVVVREGDPVTSMLFIIRGELLSSTIVGGGEGFYAATVLKPGDFCGEELLSWALNSVNAGCLPSSSVTLRALVEVEAFALSAGDLQLVANQFRRLHSRKLQDTLRYYSHQWRRWAACYIQAAWRRRQARRMERKRDWNRWESISVRSVEDGSFKSRTSLEIARFQRQDEPTD